jgi:hypothetical protein
MPDLVVRIKKKTDGSAALSCVRPDGSTTWQRQDGQLGRVFPLHDLTHLAVESVLGLRRAFFGLLAEGWDISDFAKVDRKLELTEDAGLAELIVGFFDTERMTGVRIGAAEFNEKLVGYYADRRLPVPPLRLTDADLDRIRAVRAELFSRWNALPSGEALVLPFDRPPARPS